MALSGPSDTPNNHRSSSTTEYNLPGRPIMALEHPCLVKQSGIDKAIKMVGSSDAISQSFAAGPGSSLGLNFHPEDPTSRPVNSHHSGTKNILLQVTVPKRIGRKRKRGSEASPVQDQVDPSSKGSQYLLRSLSDNPESCTVLPIGTISSTHNWHTMPDFVYSTANSTFLTSLRDQILPMKYPQMKTYQLPRTYGLTNTEVLPPPVLSSHSIPHNYGYRHNPAVKLIINPITNRTLLHNTQMRPRFHIPSCKALDPFPSTRPSSLPPLSEQDTQYKSIVATLRALFATRPLWTKRALINQLPPDVPLFIARYALAEVAFNIRSGPFRDTVCALGIDPRTDSKYRIYQTVLLQLVEKSSSLALEPGAPQRPTIFNPSNSINNLLSSSDLNPITAEAAANGTPPDPKHHEKSQQPPLDDYSRRWTRSTDPNSHLFTGTGPIPLDGKCWQLIDITDPLFTPTIESPLHHPPSSSSSSSGGPLTFEPTNRGWYAAGAWAKLKLGIKIKIEATRHGWNDEEWEEELVRFLQLPDVWDGSVGGEGEVGYVEKGSGAREMKWASAWRGMCRGMIKAEGGKGIVPSAAGDGDGEGEDEGEGGVEGEVDYGTPADGDAEMDIDTDVEIEEQDNDNDEEEEHFQGQDAVVSNYPSPPGGSDRA